MPSPRTTFAPSAAPGRGGRSALLALFMVTVAAGCSSGGGSTEPNAAFTIALSSGVLTITQGASGSVTVTIARQGGFSGAVTITVEGLPTGVTAGPLTIGSGSTSGQLTLDAVLAALVGNTNLTVRGSGTGVASATAPLQLTVNAAGGPGFTIALAPTLGTVQVGSALESTVTIVRAGGFDGAVTLTAANLPNGVSAAFNPAVTTGNNSTLTLSAGVGAGASGPTQITVQGAANGLPNQTAQFSLTVTTQPPGGGFTVDFCESTGLPLWVAYQDGSGPWTQAAGVGEVFTLDIDASTGAITWVINDGAGGFQQLFFFGTRAELAFFGEDRCNGSPGLGKTVTGTVVGLPAAPPPPGQQLVSLMLGTASPTIPPAGNGSVVTFGGVQDGPVDLIGAASDAVGLAVTPTRMLIRRGLDPAPGSSIGDIDFSGPDSFAPEMRTLTVNNLGGQFPLQTSLFVTANGSGLVSQAFGAASWYGVPAGQRQAGDIHLLTLFATELAVPPVPSRSVFRLIAQPADLTLTLGPDLTIPQVQALGGATGYARARAEYAIQVEYKRYWLAAFLQSQAGSSRQVQIQMTDGYRGSDTGTVTLEIPVLDGTAGWNADWGLRPGNQVLWTVTATGWTTPGGVIRPIFADGNDFVAASHQGTFTP